MMPPNFPLLGAKTAIYMPLFWLDKYEEYLEWGKDQIERLSGIADLFLVVADDTVPPLSPRVTVVRKGPFTAMLDFFKTAVDVMAEHEVGRFFYCSADDVFGKDDVTKMLEWGLSADVVWTNYSFFFDREFAGKSQEKVDCRFLPHTGFQNYPECSVFRTSLFREFPPREKRQMIASSLFDATMAGKIPTGKYVDTELFAYWQGREDGQYDRTFQGK